MSQVHRLLVVEDDPEIAFVLRFMLERAGYEVTVLPDGRRALEAVAKPPEVHAVILDVMLPYADGLEVLRTMRAADAWSVMPVLMLTAKSQERDVVAALDAGASDYVVKPFQPNELLARVRRMLGSR